VNENSTYPGSKKGSTAVNTICDTIAFSAAKIITNAATTVVPRKELIVSKRAS